MKNRKLVEVALPLEAISRESAREKSIRHGHPSTLHLWWARRPLAAVRAVLWASLVDDPSSRPDDFPTAEDRKTERKRLFGILERLVVWENSNDSEVLAEAKAEIQASCGDDLPNVLDPFCGGGGRPFGGATVGVASVRGRPKSGPGSHNEGDGGDSASVCGAAAGQSEKPGGVGFEDLGGGAGVSRGYPVLRGVGAGAGLGAYRSSVSEGGRKNSDRLVVGQDRPVPRPVLERPCASAQVGGAA